MMNFSGLSTAIKRMATGLSGIYGNDYNAKLYVPTGSGSVIQNPDTGNFELSQPSNQIILARLNQAKPPRVETNTQLEFSRFYVTGRLVEPLTVQLQFPQRIEADIIDNGVWINGYFYILPLVQGNYYENYEIAKALGQKIKGYFEIQGDRTT